MVVTIVAAADLGRVIGRNNGLPWRLPGDMKRFKETTLSRPVVMGRRTFESFRKPLPDRTNIVLSRDPSYAPANCRVARSLEEAVQQEAMEHDEVMVIGGAIVYAEALARCQRMLLTIVHGRFEGDAMFPELAAGEWRQKTRQHFPVDAANEWATTLFELVPSWSPKSAKLPYFDWPLS